MSWWWVLASFGLGGVAYVLPQGLMRLRTAYIAPGRRPLEIWRLFRRAQWRKYLEFSVLTALMWHFLAPSAFPWFMGLCAGILGYRAWLKRQEHNWIAVA